MNDSASRIGQKLWNYCHVLRDKGLSYIFWLRDESLEDSASLPDPHLIAAEIAEDLRASLEQIEDILGDLQARVNGRSSGNETGET